MSAMYSSIQDAINLVQEIIPKIQDQALQFDANQILGALDNIERFSIGPDVGFSNNVQRAFRREINAQKLEILWLLRKVKRAAAIHFQLPVDLKIDHFWRKEDADQPPAAVAR